MSQLLNHYSDDVFSVSSTPSAEKGKLDLLSTDILEDFADTANFIYSDRASYITGNLIRCDSSLIKSVYGGRS